MPEAHDAPRAPVTRPSDQEPGGLWRADPEIPAAAVAESRLWAPWRMRYVGSGSREMGCIFCNRLAADDDAHTLILHRGERVFAIMNLFPYNTGHVMIVPNEHIASPEDAPVATLVEMAALRQPLLRALRRALAAEGFNVGMNVGAVAGAGVADHLHEHVVPRWQGDANFMPILAATMVIPELIPVTYAKLRAELARELSGSPDAALLVLDREGDAILTRADGSLPIATAASDEPIWRAVLRAAAELGARRPEIVGWAGASGSGGEQPVLTVLADIDAPVDHRLASAAELATSSIAPFVRAGRELIARGDRP